MKDFPTYIIPENEDEMRRLYGDPESNALRESAIIELPAKVGMSSSLSVHPKAKNAIQKFFEAIWNEGYWPLLKTVSTNYWITYPNSMPPEYAATAYGAGVIINRGGRNADGNLAKPDLPGQPSEEFHAKHPIVRIAKQHGLDWGGDDHHNKQYPSYFAAGVSKI